jgi:elongation factor P
MITYFNLRKGVQFILDGQPCEVLDFRQMGKAQDVVVAKTRIKNLINGKIVDRNFHQGDAFEEADLQKMEVKFIYSNRGKLCFCESSNPRNRFELTAEQIGNSAKFLKPNQLMEAILFQGKIITVSLPIKINLKVTDAPPGVKGDRAQGGTKSVTIESVSTINVPLFVEQGDIIEVNTETGEYVRRVE